MSAAKPKPTIREVAAACGVSVQTVSAILNDKPGQASAETRERVLRAVRDLGYRPVSQWRGRQSARTQTLGVYTGVHPSSSYYQRVVYGMQLAATDAQQHLTLFCNVAWYHHVGANIRQFCDGRCDGMLVIAPEREDPHLLAMRERGIPFVVIGSSGSLGTGLDAVDSVDVDNVVAARTAVEYLIGLGHRRIAYLPGPETRASTQQRREGYRSALEAAGIVPDSALDPAGEYSQESGSTRTRDLIESVPEKERPTALFCANDQIARGAIQGLRAAGARVPDDVSVFGFDDSREEAEGDPPLTTVNQPYHQIGSDAVELLLRRLSDPPGVHEQRLLPGKMVLRASVAPPPVQYAQR